jgi:glycosyltransferase involved in cell wall biosynthesis
LKKVLHIINGEFFAGAERVQDLLALRLPEFDYSCGFICIKDGVFAKHRRSDGPIDVIPMRSKFDFSIINRISKIAKEGNYELLHTHTTRSALIGRFVAKRLHLPLVHHIHSPTQRDTDNLIKNSLNAFLENKFVLPSADHLVAVSSSLKTYVLERGVHESKVTVVRNGVPVVRDTPAWIAPTGDWTIGIVALFRPRKGIEVLLHTMRKLLDLGCPVRL